MIEILFGESEGVAMKLAKNYQQPDYEDGPTAWLGEKPDKATFEDMFAGEAVGGTSAEVIILPFMLDIGSLREPLDGTYRKQIILEQYGVYWNEDEKEEREELEQEVETYGKELQRMEQFAKQGESFRIWYSNKPYSLCGLCHAVSVLRKYECAISVVRLPDYVREEENTTVRYSSWGEVDAGQFYRFLPLEKELSEHEQKVFASRWDELKEEDALLRVLINGCLVGVKEDFYDFLIRRELPEGEIIQARLIGNLLLKYPLGISDSWYMNRIKHMIETGEIKVVKEADEIFRRSIRKEQ